MRRHPLNGILLPRYRYQRMVTRRGRTEPFPWWLATIRCRSSCGRQRTTQPDRRGAASSPWTVSATEYPKDGDVGRSFDSSLATRSWPPSGHAYRPGCSRAGGDGRSSSVGQPRSSLPARPAGLRWWGFVESGRKSGAQSAGRRAPRLARCDLHRCDPTGLPAGLGPFTLGICGLDSEIGPTYRPRCRSRPLDG